MNSNKPVIAVYDFDGTITDRHTFWRFLRELTGPFKFWYIVITMVPWIFGDVYKRQFNITALNHDLSVYDIFGCLAAGAGLVIPDEDKRREPKHWFELMQAHRVTLWNSVPALMDMLLERCV